jgi:hypothetical protein
MVMKKLVAIILSLISIASASFAEELTDKSGLPIIFSVDEVLIQKFEDIVDYSVSVKGFLYLNQRDDVAYLFDDISSLTAFEGDSALVIKVPSTLRRVFEKRSLCHVVLRGIMKKNGLSEKNPILSEIIDISVSEVFLPYAANKEQLERYVCFAQKINAAK